MVAGVAAGGVPGRRGDQPTGEMCGGVGAPRGNAGRRGRPRGRGCGSLGREARMVARGRRQRQREGRAGGRARRWAERGRGRPEHRAASGSGERAPSRAGGAARGRGGRRRRPGDRAREGARGRDTRSGSILTDRRVNTFTSPATARGSRRGAGGEGILPTIHVFIRNPDEPATGRDWGGGGDGWRGHRGQRRGGGGWPLREMQGGEKRRGSEVAR